MYESIKYKLWVHTVYTIYNILYTYLFIISFYCVYKENLQKFSLNEKNC